MYIGCSLDVDDDQVQPVPENQEDEAAELIAAAQEGPLPDRVLSILEEDPSLIRTGDLEDDDDDQVQPVPENQEDEAAELIAAAQVGPLPDKVLSILEEDPWLIRIGDPEGDTVVHKAARTGDVVTVCKLIAFIQERKDLDLKRVLTDVNFEGDTALHLALRNNHQEVAYHLVKAGHKAAYIFNNNKVSPLTLAREAGFSELLSAIPEPIPDDQVQLALEIQEDDDDVNDGAELLAAAQQGPRLDAVLSILEKDPRLIRIGDPVGDTVFHIAARAGDVVTICKLIAFILERNDLHLINVLTDVNVEGDTALHLALKNSHREVAYHFVKAGHEVAYMFSKVLSTMPEESLSALADIEMEIEKRKLEKELMRDGKKLLLLQNQRGETLLHVAAASWSRVGPLRLLVNFMINNNLHHAALLKDRNGDTALHRTLKGGSLSAARYLIKAVPETLYKVNDNGVSPLYLAVKAGNKDLVIYMMSHCRLPACATEILGHHKHTTLAHLAIKARSFGTLKTLMEHLPELIKMTDEKGWSPLSSAANKGYLEEVTYFLTHFPRSATKCDRDGSFPIHKAISRGHVSIIKAFLAHCPKELYRVDKKGRSVLHIAVRYKDYARDDDILGYLMKEVKMDGAFLNLQDNECKTFKDHAKDVKHSF